jgi:peptidoglycan/LPS O-acetylase OafA/YrhL
MEVSTQTLRAPTMQPEVTGRADTLSRETPVPHRWSTGHIRVLDGLRGCAVLSVIFYHFLGADDPRNHPVTGFAAIIQRIFGAGWCGVDLFFVLSGFLITGILLDAKGTSKTYFRSFYMRRVLRIFPLYYGVVIFTAFARHNAMLRDFFGFEDVRASLGWMYAYLSNFAMASYHNKTLFGPMGHFWSLAVEEHFYLVWPALVWLCTRRQLAIACGLFVVGAFVLRCGLAIHDHTTYATYLLSPCRVDGLALGALLAMIVRSGLDVGRLRAWAWIAGSVCLVLIVALGLRGGGGFTHYGRAMGTGGFSLFAVFFTSVMILAISAHPRSLARRALEWGPLMSVGRYSFAMYVLHLFCLRPFSRIFPIDRLNHFLHSPNLALLAFALLAAIATYILAWLSWHLYEQNFLKLKRLFPY